MSPNRERELRTRLNAAFTLRDSLHAVRDSGRSSGPASARERELEEALAGLLGAYRAPEITAISESTRESIVAKLRETAEARTGQRTESWRLNGYAVPGWLRRVWGIRAPDEEHRGDPKRRLAWVAAAIGVAALIFLIAQYASNPEPRKDQFAGQPPPKKQSPTPTPRDPKPDPKEPGKSVLPTPKSGPKPVPSRSGNGGLRTPRLPLEDRDDGWLALKQDVGILANSVGEPTMLPSAGGKPRALRPGMAVYAGAIIRTGDFDRAKVRLYNGTTVTLDFNSELRIPAPQSGAPSRELPQYVELDYGDVYCEVVESHAPFEVRTDVATASVVGTEFGLNLRPLQGAKPRERADVKPAHEAILSVKSGKVSFHNEHGRQIVGPMFESRATADSAPTAPKKIEVFSIYDSVRGLTWTRTYAPIKGAVAAAYMVYRSGTLGLELADVPLNLTPQGEAKVAEDRNPPAQTSPDESKRTRVVVVHVDNPSEGRAAGIREGDIVVAVNGHAIANSKDIEVAMLTRFDAPVLLTLEREGKPRRLSIRQKRSSLRSIQLPKLTKAEWEELDRASVAFLTGNDKEAERLLAIVLASSSRRSSASASAAHNNLGVVYHSRSRMDKAIREYQAAVRIEPVEPLYHFSLGQALHDIGNVARSIQEFREAFRLAPQFILARWELSETYHDQDLMDESIEVIKEMIKLRPNDEHLWVLLGERYSHKHDLEACEAATRRALAIHPDCYAALHQLSQIYLDRNNNQEALALAERALKLHPTHADSLIRAARALRLMNRPAEALEHAKTLFVAHPDNEYVYEELVIAHADLGQLDRALEIGRKGVSLYPNSFGAQSGLGFACYRAGLFDEAIQAFTNCVRLRPGDRGAASKVANVSYMKGDYESALNWFSRIRESYPHDPSAALDVADTLIKLGRLDEAEAECRSVIAKDGKIATAWEFLAQALSQKKDYAGAEQSYRKVVEIVPNNEVAYKDLGFVLFFQSKYEGALEAFSRALKLEPESNVLHQIHDGMSRVLLAQGKYEEAEAALNKAIAVMPKAGFYHRSLGALYEKWSKKDKAIEAYKRALELNPTDQAAKDALLRLDGV